MLEIFNDGSFWIGVAVGSLIVAFYVYRRRATHRIGYFAAVNLAEKLQTAYRNKDLEGIEEFRDEYLNGKAMYIFEKKEEPNAMQLWSAILIYVAHRYADRDFGEHDSREWKDIVAKTFGNKSIALEIYAATDDILNRSTAYYYDTSTAKINHGAIKDYGKDGLYEMIATIIKGSYWSNISFEY